MLTQLFNLMDVNRDGYLVRLERWGRLRRVLFEGCRCGGVSQDITEFKKLGKVITGREQTDADSAEQLRRADKDRDSKLRCEDVWCVSSGESPPHGRAFFQFGGVLGLQLHAVGTVRHGV
jgi:Ca2+-binding EF-hand superfamily protein